MKECQHDGEIFTVEVPKTMYDLDTHSNVTIPNLWVRYEQCEQCFEERKEVFFKEDEELAEKLKNNQYGEKYVVREEYYTNGGSLVQKDGFGNWYYNGEKMTAKRLKQKMQAMGDKFGDQDVSDNFKEIAHAAKRKQDEKRFKKTQRLEEIRDQWE